MKSVMSGPLQVWQRKCEYERIAKMFHPKKRARDGFDGSVQDDKEGAEQNEDCPKGDDEPCEGNILVLSCPVLSCLVLSSFGIAIKSSDFIFVMDSHSLT